MELRGFEPGLAGLREMVSTVDPSIMGVEDTSAKVLMASTAGVTRLGLSATRAVLDGLSRIRLR